jgi:hypothetical protein
MKNSAVVAALDSGEIKGAYASPELRSQLINAGYEVAVDIYNKNISCISFLEKQIVIADPNKEAFLGCH